MTWVPDQWRVFCALLESGWPGEFGEVDRKAYRMLLDDVDPDRAFIAVKQLLHSGVRFRPSVSELLGTVRADPSAPTFEEAYRLIFGARGVLRAKPVRRVFGEVGEQRAAYQQAILERAREFHPLLASFVERQGVDRLQGLEVDDPEFGELRRKELREAWDRHVRAVESREVAMLASGGRGLRRLDPMGAVAQIEERSR